MNKRTSEVISKLERFMSTVEDAWALPREAAMFVHSLVMATGAKRAVEIGTSYGYSALWIASALDKRNGRLVTIDHEQRKSEAARANLEEAGLAKCVELITATAKDALASLEGPVDFVLVDADKENCQTYVELVADKLADWAIVLTDNTTSHAAQLADFVEWIRDREDFFSSHISVGNGMELSIKLTLR